MYKAHVIEVANVINHPNADRLDIVTFNGETYIVGRDDFEEGDIAIIFPGDGKLADEFLKYNNLYRHNILNADVTKSGYFSNNQRVSTEKLRGVASYGVIVSPAAFSYIGKKLEFKPGSSFDAIKGHIICEKYYSPATIRAREIALRSKKKVYNYGLRKHKDTTKLAFGSPSSGLVILTEKLHGTSGRTGYVLEEKVSLTWWEKLLYKFKLKKNSYRVVTGTRNTICIPGWVEASGKESHRLAIHDELAGKIRLGETIYYEVVGFDGSGTPIMNVQSTSKIKDKQFKQNFPNPIVYSYGETTFTFYVYRITQEIHGEVLELTWDQVVNRCNALGIKPVPELSRFYHYNEGTPLAEYPEITSLLYNGESTLDPNTLFEGVCIRVENSTSTIFKVKNFMFGVLEGYLKQKDDYVDTEEAA